MPRPNLLTPLLAGVTLFAADGPAPGGPPGTAGRGVPLRTPAYPSLGTGVMRPVGPPIGVGPFGGVMRPVGGFRYGPGYGLNLGFSGYGGTLWPYGFGVPFGYDYGFAGGSALTAPGGYDAGQIVPADFEGVGHGGSYSRAPAAASPPAVVFKPVPTAPDRSALPPAPAGFAAEADQLARAGKYEDAARAYRHAMVDDPRDGRLAVRASQALAAAGESDDAAGAARQGFALIDPKDWLTEAQNAANVFGDTRASAAAYEGLLKASADAKAGPGVKFLTGVAAAGRGDYARASAEFDAATRLAPQDALAARWKNVVDAKK